MAFPASKMFKPIFKAALENTAAIDLNSDVIKCALYPNSITGTFDFDADAGYGTAPWTTAAETTGTGYTAGGATLATPAVTIASGVLKFDAGDASWASSSITARGGLVYDDTLDYGIVAVNFGADFTSVSGTFTVQWNASGILTITN